MPVMTNFFRDAELFTPLVCRGELIAWVVISSSARPADRAAVQLPANSFSAGATVRSRRRGLRACRAGARALSCDPAVRSHRRSASAAPFPDSLFADAEIARHFDHPFTGTNAAGHQESTVGGGARILVDVHPGPRLGLLTVGNHQFPQPAPDEQPM